MFDLYYNTSILSFTKVQRRVFMSVRGNINEVLKQIEFLIKLYGDATFTDIQHSVQLVRRK